MTTDLSVSRQTSHQATLKPARERTSAMHRDSHLELAIEQVEKVSRGELSAPSVKSFFDEPTFTASYVVYDAATKHAAIIDSVLDFDQPSGRKSTGSADAIVDFVHEAGLTVDWLLETHAHADHLSAASYLQGRLGGKLERSSRATGPSSTGCWRTAIVCRSATSRS